MTENTKEEAKREFALQRVYTKDVSFETPNTPAIFQQEWKPDTKVNLNTEMQKLGEGVYEVVLSVTVTTTIGEETAYLAEAKQAGIFTITGFSDQELGPLIGAFCPSQLLKRIKSLIISNRSVHNTSRFFQQAVFRTDARIIKPGCDGMRRKHLPLLVLQQIALGAVENTGSAVCEWGRMRPPADTGTGRLHTNQPHAFII